MLLQWVRRNFDPVPKSKELFIQCPRFVRVRLELLERHTVKKNFSIFPSSAGMSLTKLSMGGNNNVIKKLFPPRESLVSDIPAGDRNIESFFTLSPCTIKKKIFDITVPSWDVTY